MRVGQPKFTTPLWEVDGVFNQDISKSFGVGLENRYQFSRWPHLSFTWGFMPTYQKLEEYSEQEYEANGISGTVVIKTTTETKFRFVDLAIPVKGTVNFHGVEISTGLTTVYHATARINSISRNINSDTPDTPWENISTSHSCNDWLKNCDFNSVSWDFPADFWFSADIGYRLKRYKVSLHFDQNLTKAQLHPGSSDFALIDSTVSSFGFWGNSNISTQNIGLQMSYRLY